MITIGPSRVLSAIAHFFCPAAGRQKLSAHHWSAKYLPIFAKLGLVPQADDERRVLAVIQNLRG
jgi:hypothetical protein